MGLWLGLAFLGVFAGGALAWVILETEIDRLKKVIEDKDKAIARLVKANAASTVAARKGYW